MTTTGLHEQVLRDLSEPGDWWDADARRALMEAARAARACSCADPGVWDTGTAVSHVATGTLTPVAVEVIHRIVNDPGRLTREWMAPRIDALGDAHYAELVGVTAIVTAIDVFTRAMGLPDLELATPEAGEPARQRPEDVGDIGAWIPMTEEKVLANVTRALSLVPRTNGTWRQLVTESYSRGPEMLELTWERALSRPQIELIAARVSRIQECFY